MRIFQRRRGSLRAMVRFARWVRALGSMRRETYDDVVLRVGSFSGSVETVRQQEAAHHFDASSECVAQVQLDGIVAIEVGEVCKIDQEVSVYLKARCRRRTT